jgi:DNA-binding LytR/AlgR family response regulator
MALKKLSIDDKEYHFNYSGKDFSLKSKDIVCFIIFDKGITIYTKNDRHRMFGTLKELEAMLDINYFIRIRNNCIINCEYIKCINNNKIELLDGISIGQNDLTIPRGKIKEIKKKIYNFLILKGEEK